MPAIAESAECAESPAELLTEPSSKTRSVLDSSHQGAPLVIFDFFFLLESLHTFQSFSTNPALVLPKLENPCRMGSAWVLQTAFCRLMQFVYGGRAERSAGSAMQN